MHFYEVFYTDKALPEGVTPDLAMVIPLDFPTKEEALKEAFKLIYRGAVVWKIEGPEGFHLDRAEVERQYQIFRIT